MNNWAKLLHKENLELRKEAKLLREHVKLMKQVNHLKQEVRSRKPSTIGIQTTKAEGANFTFSAWGQVPIPSQKHQKKILSFQESEIERPLLESFESYYESEEENLEKNGKCELSYLAYKVNHARGSRRNSRFTQVSDYSTHSPKLSIFSHKIKSRKSSVKSSVLDEILNGKQKNCEICDKLLYKGLPSSKCRKHNIIN